MMIFKFAAYALLLLKGIKAEAPNGTLKDGYLNFGEFTTAFEEATRNIRGSGRTLQRLPIFSGKETDSEMTVSEKTDSEETDREDGGLATMDDVRANISRLIKGVDGGKNGYEDCKTLFNAFDKDKDNDLSPDELTIMFEAAGNSRSESEVLSKTMMFYYDRSKDTSLQLLELVAACKGDPHFITWYGNHFSYHGACDLVLLQNPSFSDGKGLDLHVRTEHMLDGAFSYISNAALKIGDDILEIVDDGSHFLNGKRDTELPARVGGYPITKRVKETCHGTHGCSYATIFNVALIDKDSVKFTVASNMIHVDVSGSHTNFQGSSGLMGTYPAMHHGKIARDGVTFLREPDEFAEEWQVLESEVKLFQDARFPQHPKQCIPAVKSAAAERHLQMGEDKEARTVAEEACAHVKGPEWEFCIFDVMATGDYGMAAIIYG